MAVGAVDTMASDLVRANGKLYNFVDGAFVLLKEAVEVSISKEKDKEGYPSFVLSVFDKDGKKITHQNIDSGLLARFYASELSIVWVVFVNEQRVSLSLKFATPESFVQFRNQFSVCLYEVNNPTQFTDLKEEDQRYVMDSARDDIVMDTTEDEKDLEEDSFLEEPKEGAKVEAHGDAGNEQNRHLAVAYNNDRTFVIRGNNMGVFKADDEGMKFQSLVRIKDQKKNAFAPSHAMLHEQDASMLFLNPSDGNKVYRMDLERGDIVNEFNTNHYAVNTLSSASKYANLTPGQEFLGVSKSTMMRFDPRDRDFVVQSKAYAPSTKTRFTNMATTGNGYIAIGSENGDIRMYNELGKNAKTHLSGLGDPILGVDATEDGAYILATTKNYLLLIDTRVKGEEKGGFQKSMGKKKPAPLKLTIKPTDIIKYKIKEISFTPAHFNVGRSLERSIVASTGPFIITWNFRHVKQGKLESYQIKRYKDNVVADNFAFDDEEKIIVTLPDDVTVNRLRRRG